MKNRPYIFYDTTESICSTCFMKISASIVIQDNAVFMHKMCPAHGIEKVLIADDADFYRLGREVYIKPPEMPQKFNTAFKYGCPYDCGLCSEHMQHSCLTIIEINEICNLKCPVCYADSSPDKKLQHDLATICKMLDAIVANEGTPDVVQISGGEPTLHPDFFAILDAAKARPIRHLMINTNGIKLAQDKDFVKRLAEYQPGIEIYLQFDSLDDDVLQQIRGAKLAEIHNRALENLNFYGISTTLVVTLIKGVNDHQIGEILEFASLQSCVRGVTFQPMEFAGRVSSFGSQHRITLSEVRRKVCEQSDLFSLQDIIPVPCNPDALAMGYAIKLNNKITPLTRYVSPEVLLAGKKNTIVFENDLVLKEQIFKLFATNLSPDDMASNLSQLMCCLPDVIAPELSYKNVFRVLIMNFMDAVNFDVRAVKKSCVHIVQPDGKIIPFETNNLFYRNKRSLLKNIRQKIADYYQINSDEK